ncbi:hypothetical protein M405DRAFT_505498 [Rhizopogon salebrosus TDB-379]|nr:hypothetical protein M405DRAFT_505498 [Rhizopogon salebrosus TDB-379]
MRKFWIHIQMVYQLYNLVFFMVFSSKHPRHIHLTSRKSGQLLHRLCRFLQSARSLRSPNPHP